MKNVGTRAKNNRFIEGLRLTPIPFKLSTFPDAAGPFKVNFTTSFNDTSHFCEQMTSQATMDALNYFELNFPDNTA